MQRFIPSPPTLAVYDVSQSLPLGGAVRDFPFTEDETQRHFSYLSGTFREKHANKSCKCFFICQHKWDFSFNFIF